MKLIKKNVALHNSLKGYYVYCACDCSFWCNRDGTITNYFSNVERLELDMAENN